MERESMDFHERVRHEYLRLADAEPERIVVIDAVGTIEEVFSEIRGVLVERFDGGVATIDEGVDGSAGSVTAAGAGADAPAEAPAEVPAETEDTAAEVASSEASTEEASPTDAPDTAGEETATDEAEPVLVDTPATAATRKHRPAKASHKGSTEKRSSRKPATMVGALGESQGALWDE